MTRASVFTAPVFTAPVFAAPAFAAFAAAICLGLLGCGDSLVDHNALGLGAPDGGNPDGGGCAAPSASSCGADCAACAEIANAAASCVNDACVYECASGYLRTATGCSRASAIAAGGDTTCAIVQAGEVRCWGANDHGQLGSSTAASLSRMPVHIVGISGATSVVVGSSHACALTPDGVRCWGANGSGQLGQAGADSAAPLSVGLPAGVQQLAAGGRHSCAATGSGVFCWGANDLSQLGGSSLTKAVPDLTSLGGLAAGLDHTCAFIAPGGELRCWGANGSGQLGGGSTSTAEAQPAQPFGSGVTGIIAGSHHTCAIQATKMFCWGDGTLGQLGDRLRQSSSSPVEPGSVSGPGVIAAGGAHTCVAFAGGGGSSNLSCWGKNDSGQLGIGSTGLQTQPAKVSLTGVQAVAAGASHTCALIDGAVSCWGANDKGQVGSGTGAQVLSPAMVTGK